MRYYLDSCLVIYLFEGSPTSQAAVRNALASANQDEMCVSPLVRLECRIGPLRRHDAPALLRFDQFLAQAISLDVDAAAFEEATNLRAQYNVQTSDAIHVATAIIHRCDEFWTNDTGLLRLSPRILIRIIQ